MYKIEPDNHCTWTALTAYCLFGVILCCISVFMGVRLIDARQETQVVAAQYDELYKKYREIDAEQKITRKDVDRLQLYFMGEKKK